jgi:Serine aminopeptidase, S33
MAGDMVRLLDRLSVARACVVGLSMGAQIAMEFARAFPDRTAAIVFAATFPQAETSESVEHRNKMAERLMIEGMAIAGSEMLIGPASLKNQPSIAATVYQMICSTDLAGAAAALRGRALRRDYRESLTHLEVPCLIVLGTDDVTVASTKQRQCTPRSRVPGWKSFRTSDTCPTLRMKTDSIDTSMNFSRPSPGEYRGCVRSVWRSANCPKLTLPCTIILFEVGARSHIVGPLPVFMPF